LSVARALVTGASGFVGPHLVAALERAGHEVWTTDREAPATPAAAARHASCDLGDPVTVRALCDRVRPEWIFHLASLSSVAYSFQNPRDVLLTNVGASVNVLEAVRHVAPAARVLVIGSAEQYGNVPEAEQPIRETQPFRPTSPYAVSKVAQEHLALQYALAFGLQVVATRSFNHSGPGQTDRFVLPSFARQVALAERGEQAPVLRVGNLDVWRDFLDVRDVVRAYVLLIEKGEAGQAYNVCRGEAHRIHDLLDILLGLSRVPMRVETDAARARPADLRILRGDPQRLRTRTGWQPEVTLATTLHDILEEWRQRAGQGGAA
jgi:GDP-4-dehydro-6-deoxy-D-mannose reductase